MSEKMRSRKPAAKANECETHLGEADRCIRKAITEISSVVITECRGIENLTPSRISELRAVMNTLVDIRDKHFTDWHRR